MVDNLAAVLWQAMGPAFSNGKEMKYLLILFFLASIAGIEYFYELASNEAPASTMCSASTDEVHSVGDVLRQHLGSHR